MINCKVELQLKWTNHCILGGNGNDNDNVNSNDIIFTIKDTKLNIHVVTLTAKGNQKLLKRLSKGLERSGYWNEYKTKNESKNATNK